MGEKNGLALRVGLKGSRGEKKDWFEVVLWTLAAFARLFFNFDPLPSIV